MEYDFQCAVIPPFGKSGIHRLPGAIRLRQFPPLRPAARNPEHPVEHLSVIFPGTPSLPCSFRRQHRFYAFPLFFCQFISFHAPIYITKNGEGDLVVMSIEAFERREEIWRLRAKLAAAEEQSRLSGQPTLSMEESRKRLEAIYGQQM